MNDLLILALPFALLVTATLPKLISKTTETVADAYIKCVLLGAALLLFIQILIMVNNTRRIVQLMSPEAFNALKIPRTIFDKSDLTFGYFYARDDLIFIYSTVFVILFGIACWILFFKK